MADSPPSTAPGPPTLAYPAEAWIPLGVFLVVIGLFQWSSVLHSKLVGDHQPQTNSKTDEELLRTPQGVSPSHSTGTAKYSLHRLPLAVINVFRVVAFRWTLELGPFDLSIADIVLTVAYLAFLFAWTFEVGVGHGAEELQYQISWTSRAGLLAASQFPLVTALGTKNNIVSLVTGVGYEKLNFIHRITARSCFVLLLVHGGGEINTLIRVGYVNVFLDYPWIRIALTALVSLAVLSVVSLRVIRSRVYELFFYSHFILVFIFLLCAYFHTKETGNMYWIWPCFLIWGFDRFLRFVRVVVFNYWYCGLGRRAKLQDATVELLSGNVIRVRVHRPSYFQWYPGQAAFLIMPSISMFPLEAHPFSISTVDSDLFQRSPTATRNGQCEGDAEFAQWKELVFIINSRAGFTKRLKEVAVQKQTVKLFIDGPYGSAPDMSAYNTCILVAGGIGITCLLPILLSTIETARKRSGQCRRVVFIWAIPYASRVQWVSSALSRVKTLTPSWLTVSIRIFVTKGGIDSSKPFTSGFEPRLSVDPELPPPDEDGSESYVSPMSLSRPFSMASVSVQMENGRPDVQAILRDEVSRATGSMSVTVCGPQDLTRSVRRALRFPVSGPNSVLSGGPSVTLHVESFGYA